MAITAAPTHAQTATAQTPLEALFAVCTDPDIAAPMRAEVLQRAGWHVATDGPATQRRIAEQRALQVDRGTPARPWADVLDEVFRQATAPPQSTFFLDGDVPSLLLINVDPVAVALTCGYSASVADPQAMRLLMNVGKEDVGTGGTLTIKSALTLRAKITDDARRNWQVEAASFFADPDEISRDTATPFTTAIALRLTLQPADT